VIICWLRSPVRRGMQPGGSSRMGCGRGWRAGASWGAGWWLPAGARGTGHGARLWAGRTLPGRGSARRAAALVRAAARRLGGPQCAVASAGLSRPLRRRRLLTRAGHHPALPGVPVPRGHRVGRGGLGVAGRMRGGGVPSWRSGGSCWRQPPPPPSQPPPRPNPKRKPTPPRAPARLGPPAAGPGQRRQQRQHDHPSPDQPDQPPQETAP